MRKNASQNASKKYPELHIRDGSPYWFFRKYSKEKKREFLKSTGISAKEGLAYKAYKNGREEFDKWLGTALPTNRTVLMRDIFRVVLASKESLKKGKKGSTYRSCHNQVINHLMPAFGHLKPDQITAQRWKDYDQAERIKVRFSKYGKPIYRTALKNTRKYLVEAMIRAESDKLILEVPDFGDFDPKPKPPKYLDKQTVRNILKKSFKQSKILYYILWKQGPRPEEAMQYEWDMIHWNEGKYGYIHIPGRITKTGRSRAIPLNSKVSRILKSLIKKRKSIFIFPSRYKPGSRQTNYIKGWNSACQLLGIDATPYNLRDTFITNSLKKGRNAIFIGKYIDSSASEIEKKYAVAEQKTMEEVAE